MSRAEIDLRIVQDGDRVTIEDRERNRATGPVLRTVEADGTTLLRVDVFGTYVHFARTNRNDRLVGNPDARVVAHQPPLTFLDGTGL